MAGRAAQRTGDGVVGGRQAADELVRHLGRGRGIHRHHHDLVPGRAHGDRCGLGVEADVELAARRIGELAGEIGRGGRVQRAARVEAAAHVDQLLRQRGADAAHQQPDAAAIGRQADALEHLGEAGGLARGRVVTR